MHKMILLQNYWRSHLKWVNYYLLYVAGFTIDLRNKEEYKLFNEKLLKKEAITEVLNKAFDEDTYDNLNDLNAFIEESNDEDVYELENENGNEEFRGDFYIPSDDYNEEVKSSSEESNESEDDQNDLNSLAENLIQSSVKGQISIKSYLKK